MILMNEFSFVRNDTIDVNNAHTDYLSSHTVTQPRQDPPRLTINFLHSSEDPNQQYPMTPQPQRHFSKKKQTFKIWLSILSTCFGKRK